MGHSHLSREKPTHIVVVSHKTTKAKAVVGVAWQNEWGFSLCLNPGTVLDWRMCEEYFISVKPMDAGRRSTRSERDELPPVEGWPKVG